MSAAAFRSLLAEPRAANPPVRVWRDWVLVALLVPAAIVEVIFREDAVWRPWSFGLTLLHVSLLLWRRTHPLAVVLIGFGAIALTDAVALLVGVDGAVGLYTSACVLILVYALFRWGSGREAAIGLPLILLVDVLAIAVDYTGIVDAVLGTLFLLVPVELGAAVRYRSSYRQRTLEQVQLRERERLARELHDTVAHHVSAIAVRAQAGQVVAESQPAAAAEALQVIEEEASRTLAELRAMVGVLRAGERAELAPLPGASDIPRLARSDQEPRVEVSLSGDLDQLGPAVDAALYRIAQESITNAMRHARDASLVTVQVCAEPDAVRLSVRDNGALGTGNQATDGYGLVGMTERAVLLGGTLEAGPAPDGGWAVSAVIPRSGATR